MDDDSSMVQFSGNFIGNFPEIVRSGSLANDAFVDFGSIDGTAIGITDYTPTSGTLTFKANTRATVIPLVIFNDTIAEGFETFTYLLRNPRGTKLGPQSQQTFTITDNDFGGSNIQFTQPLFGGGEGTTVTLTIVRTGGIGSSLVVQWSAGAGEGEGTATPGVDFTPASGTVTFGVNAQTASFTINVLTDSFVEGTETVPITLSMPEAAATLGPQSTTTLQIQDAAPPASVVQFTAPTFSAAYGQDKEITLTRSGALGTPLTVNWATTGGTAVPGEDFDPAEGVVTFGPNDTTASFTITTREASSGEPDLTAIFGLSIASGTATIGAVGTTTLTIFGATSEINLDLSVYSVTEGGGPAIISVSRRGNLNRQVSASFATSNGTAIAGTHYATQTGTVTFPVGVETATFTVPILSNGPGDGTRTVNLTLSNPSPNTTLGEGDSARLDIREGPVYTFRRIAETDAEQDGEVFAFAGAPGINDAGTVAFRALLTDVRERIVTGNGGALSTVAGTSPGGFVEFGNRVPIDNNGQVAFLALRANETQGIFRGDEESLSTVATTSAQLSQLFDPAMSRNGRVAFVGQTPQGPLRLFSGTPGGPFPLVPGTDGSLFTNLGIHPAVNDDGRVAFVANSEPGRGIYSVAPNGDIEILADDVEVVTSTNVSFNNFGRLAFIPGLGNIRQSVLLSAGEGDVVPFATAANGFQNFGDVSEDDNSPVISDRGDVAFVALTQAGNLGILNGPSPTGNMAIQVGDPLFGSTVAFLTFGAINASGQIAFRATLLDGREVVAVATPPATLADLAVTKAVNNASPLVGANVTFTVTATNNGPAAVTTATVTDLLPSGYTFVSATPSKGSYASATGIWTIGALTGTAPGNSATLTITATVRATGTYANTASISAVGVTDPVPANNSATATATPALAADIAVTKTVNIPSPVIGSNVIFTLTATNNGPGAATGVQVTDLLPTGYTFVSSLPGQGTYTSASGIWAVGSLAANASATLQLTAQVRATGTYLNTATRTASTPSDPVAANNSATATVSPISGIALTTDGPLVGVGRSINGAAAIPTPAPAGGVTVTLTSNPTGLLTLPATVTINQGQTSAPFTLTGVAPGATTITGTAPGFGSGTVPVTVTSSVISLGALPNLGPGQTASLPISLSTAAPASGVTVSFSSTNPSVATVTPSVFIPGGAQVPAANPQVTAVAVGSAQINAAAIGFAPDSRTANAVVNVTFTPTTLNVVVGTTSNITVNIASPAPSNGLTLALATANTNVATVASPVTIPAGQLSVQAVVTGVTAGQSTTLQATGTGVTSATANINVTQPPTINLTNPTVGRDLQAQASASLAAAAPAGGVQLTVSSGDPARLLVSTSATAQGSAQVVLPISAGQSGSSLPLFFQGLNSTGSVQVTATAPGYAPRAVAVTLVPSGFVINPFQLGNFTTTTLSANQTVQITPAQLNPSGLNWVNNLAVRGGLGPINVTVTATDQPTGGSSVGTIVGSPVVFNGGDTLKNVAFDPAAAGTSLIQVVTPTGFNFSTPGNSRSVTATVTAPAINVSAQTVGRDLQTQGSLSLGTAAPTGGVQVTLTSADDTRVRLSTSATTLGSGQIVLTINTGGVSPTTGFFVQALDGTGTVQLTATAPGYADGVATVTLRPSGFVINPFQLGNFTTTTFSANQPVQITPAILNTPTLTWATNQTLRPGLAPVIVTVTATDQPTGGSSVGTIVGSPVTFNGNDTFKNVQFDPVAGGVSLIEVVTPTGFNFSTPASARSVTATVSTPAINFSPQTIGRDLQVQTSLSLQAPAPTGGVQVTVTSAEPSRVLLATSATGQGSNQITLPINAGSTSSSTPIFIQALDGTGTVQVTAGAPGYANQVATMTLAPSGFVINPFQLGNFSTTTFSANTTIQITPAVLSTNLTFAANQTVRSGLTQISVPVTAVDQPGSSGVGTIVGSPAVFNGGDTFKNVQFDPAAAGISQVQVGTPTGFSTPANARVVTATVTAPAITFGSTTFGVGQNLQGPVSISLAATPPNPVTVTVTVSSTAVATIVSSTTPTVEGSNTVTFTNVSSTFVGTILVQGRAASGTTTVTAQAAGFADGTMTVTATPSGFTLINLGNFTTTTTGANATLQITPARLNPSTLNFELNQAIRGGFSISVPVTAVDQSGSGVGVITVSPLAFTANQSAQITAFDPVNVGTSLISVGVPSGFATPSNFRQITATVTAP